MTRDGISVSIYPITRDQWEALQDVAAGLGTVRADLLRDAIRHLLDERDAGTQVVYPASPRLRTDEKAGIQPRAVWLRPPLYERFRDRCVEDRVSQSEFALEAIRRYLAAKGSEIDPPI